MNTFTPLIAACAILMACDGAQDLAAPPYAPPQAPPTYTLFGIVRDETGTRLGKAGAAIVEGDPRLRGRLTTSNENGVFSFQGVWGELQVRVVKFGYGSYLQAVRVDADIGIDVQLPRSDAILSDTILLGKTIRAVTDAPPCDPVRWDASAPCRRFYFAPRSSGMLVITITSGGPVDATIWTARDDAYVAYSEAAGFSEAPGSQMITLKAGLVAGESYEIRVNSYHGQAEFDLRADLYPFAQ